MSLPRAFRNIACLNDLEAPAQAFLPRALWEFVSTGAEANRSRDGNRTAFDKYWFVPRVLNDVRERFQSQTLFDHKYDLPFGIAPMGASALFGFEADLNYARAAAKANVPYVMSGSALIPMEKVAAANPDVWFQAYVDADRSSIAALTDRVWEIGIRKLVITADVPVSGNRKVSLRSGFEYPVRPNLRIAWDGLTHPRWLLGNFIKTLMTNGMPHIENYGPGRGIPIVSTKAPERANKRDGLNWEDMRWLRDRWRGRLLIKGVLSPDDAATARQIGLDGLLVSNHGGRILDGSIPPLHQLSHIVAEKGDMAVLYDGGIRWGTDVLKALALGADFVLIGRPFMYAAALAEEAGVTHVIELLQAEIDRNMALLGLTDFSDLAARISPAP